MHFRPALSVKILFQSSGLSEWIGTQLTPLNALSPFVANLICCLVICALTQCTSNTSTATIFLPILAELVKFKNFVRMCVLTCIEICL